MLERTPKLALRDLTSRLVFGNEDQIDAVNILGLAEELIGAWDVCPECGGEGKVGDDEEGHCDKCGRACMICDADLVKCDECDGEGETRLRRDQVYAMKGTEIFTLVQSLNVERTHVVRKPALKEAKTK